MSKTKIPNIKISLLSELFYCKGNSLFNKVNRGTRAKKSEIAGNINNDGYRVVRLGSNISAHRIVFAMHHGYWSTMELDHKDTDKLNNNINNLREVSRAVNGQNLKLYPRNTFGILGVNQVTKKSGNKFWRTSISVNKKEIYLYYGQDFFEACCRRKSAENKYYDLP